MGTLLVAGLASAQTASTLALAVREKTLPDIDLVSIGADQCNTTLTFTWYFNQGNPCSSLQLWSTDGDCGDAPGTNDVRYDDVSQLTLLAATSKQGDFAVRIAALPGFAAKDTTTPCGMPGITKTHKICGAVETTLGTCGLVTASKLRASPLRVVYDTLPPGAPTINEVSATNGTAAIVFSVDSDTATVRPEWKGPDDADFFTATDSAATATSARVTGLANGTTYDFRLRAVDSVGNVSEPSAIFSATIIRTVGFWGAYREAGGTDQGGCSVVGVSPVLVGVWLLLKRGRR
ncbi:MAG: hypothetical protein JNG84_05980 [Archangium sp.]|nr:hypothetical protein [Archangium sp.]